MNILPIIKGGVSPVATGGTPNPPKGGTGVQRSPVMNEVLVEKLVADSVSFERTEGDDGSLSLVNDRVVLAVLPDGDIEAFKRNAFKNVGGGPLAYKEIWAVGGIDGVRCYVSDRDGVVKIVLTRQDLYP